MVAVGLNLIFGVLRVLNVAHGSLYATGVCTAAALGLFVASRGLPGWLVLTALIAAALLVGLVLGPPIERLLRRTEGGEPVLQLLLTFAVFMIFEDVQKLVFGVQPVVFDAPLKMLGTVDIPFGQDVIPFTAYQLFVLPGIAVVTLLGLALFLRRARSLPGSGRRRSSSPLRSSRPQASAKSRRGRDLAPDRARTLLCRLFRAGARGGRALPHHGRGPARAAAGPVRGPGDAPDMSRRTALELAAALAAAAVVLAVAGAVPWLRFVFTIAIAKGIAVFGIILLLLWAGQVSFGYALYVALAAYTAAFAAPRIPEVLMLLPLGALLSGAVGLMVGLFVVRYRDFFFGMLSLALSMVFYSVLEKFYALTHGTDGIRLPPVTYLGSALSPDEAGWANLVTAGARVRGLRTPLPPIPDG